MDLTPDSEQLILIDATADWCRSNMPLERARNRQANLWRDLQEMGWLGMTAPEMAFDHATETLVFAELGRHIAPVSMLSSAVAARWAGHSGHTALALKDEESGTAKVRIFDPEDANRALGLLNGLAAIFSLPAEMIGIAGLDPSARLASFDQEPKATSLRDPSAAWHLQLLASAFAVGCADAARDMAAEYAKLREQFERPIGWFQAIKHICSDMAVRCEVARSQLYYAACALDAQHGDAAFHIAAAKRLADAAALENSRANIQVHGGIGMTDEAYPHLCLKRAHLLSFIAPARRDIILGDAA